MIDKLCIKGFKCFDDVSLEMRAITMLAGQNSIGKSSIIQSLLALKQGKTPFTGKYMTIGTPDELLNAYGIIYTLNILCDTMKAVTTL